MKKKITPEMVAEMVRKTPEDTPPDAVYQASMQTAKRSASPARITFGFLSDLSERRTGSGIVSGEAACMGPDHAGGTRRSGRLSRASNASE